MTAWSIVASGFHFIIVWKKPFRASGKIGEFCFAKFVSSLYVDVLTEYEAGRGLR